VKSLRARMNALETAEVIPSQLQASDGDPNPALSADAAGALTAAIAPFTLTGGQLAFPASQNASADANTLDDYEEGTWTPGVSFGGASVGVTYGVSNAGYYTKVGNIATVTGYLVLTSKGSSVGAALITGLPFTVVNDPAGWSAASLLPNKVTFANQIFTQPWINLTVMLMYECTEAGVLTQTNNGDFNNVTTVSIEVVYRVD